MNILGSIQTLVLKEKPWMMWLIFDALILDCELWKVHTWKLHNLHMYIVHIIFLNSCLNWLMTQLYNYKFHNMPSNIKHIQNIKYVKKLKNILVIIIIIIIIYLGAVLVGCFTPWTVLQSTVNLVKEEACTPNHLATSPW